MEKVLKFGGTSLANAQRFETVVEICKKEQPKFVVVSAVAGITNMLVTIVESLKNNDKEYAKHVLHEISEIFVDIISECFYDIDYINKSQLILANHYSVLNEQLNKTSFDENIILVQGELITSKILHLYFGYRNFPVLLIDAQSIISVDKFGNPEEKLIAEKIAEQTSKFPNQVFLTQGFICSDNFGNICTLGRGGSDLTASLVGAAINASSIQIWTDISGLHNNDPRFVDETFPLEELSFNEAAELAYFGAKILHPVCILPAKEKNIPVFLKNTLKPNETGTIITSRTNQNGIKAIAAKDDITIIKIKSARMLMSHGFLKRIFEIFDAHKISVDVITTSEVAVSLTVDYKGDLSPLSDELRQLGEVEVVYDQVIICIVGEGLIFDGKSVRKILESISDIPIQMISLGGSKINVTLVTDALYKKMILNELHTRLMKISYVA